MAITDNSIQVVWGSANSVSVAAGSSQDSDAFDANAGAFQGQVTLKANNGGTPAGGDTIEFYALQTTGDPDADPDSADEFATSNHGTLLAVLDTNQDNPAVATVKFPYPYEASKIRAVSNAASAITVSAQILEQTV